MRLPGLATVAATTGFAREGSRGRLEESAVPRRGRGEPGRGVVRLIWPLIRDCDFATSSSSPRAMAGTARSCATLPDAIPRRHQSRKYRLPPARFRDATNIVFVRNDGVSLDAIPDRTATLVYCFDAMVHFDSDVVRAYLRDSTVSSAWRSLFLPLLDLHWQSDRVAPRPSRMAHFMSRELFEHYAWKEGLSPLWSQLIRADGDATTLLEKPKLKFLHAYVPGHRRRRVGRIGSCAATWSC